MAVNYQNVTIASDGSLALSGTGVYRVDTFNGDPTDEITSITGMLLHEVAELRLQVSTHIWTLRHNTSLNICLQENLDFTPDTLGSAIWVRWQDITGTNKAVELTRSRITSV